MSQKTNKPDKCSSPQSAVFDHTFVCGNKPQISPDHPKELINKTIIVLCVVWYQNIENLATAMNRSKIKFIMRI